MDEEGSMSKEKTWGFRRSTIARREFIAAVTTALNSTPAPRRGARLSRGRGRGRGRGKQVNELAVISAVPRCGRGGRKRAAESVLTPADEQCNEDEACGVTRGSHCATAELKSGDNFVTEEAVSDRAEDSDDLSLQEIRRRAISRRLQELRHEGNVNVKDTDYAAEGSQLVEHEDVTMLDDPVSSKGGAVLASSVRGANRNSDGVTNVQEVTGDQTVAKKAKTDSAEEESTDNSEEASDRVDGDVSCCVCQQTHKNRLMICCDSCLKWHHTDCVGITEAHGRLLLKNDERYTCSVCSEDHSIIRKIRNTNKISTLPAVKMKEIVEETSEQQKTAEQMKLEEKVNEVKEVKDALPQCTGPGCSNNALPGSVYCGHQCIVEHAAVAMKSLSEAETETKPAVPSAKPLLQTQKRSFLAKLFKVKISESPSCEEKASTQEMVNDELVCCAEVTDPEQPPSAAAVDDKPIIKEKEVELKTDPQSEPSDVNMSNPSSEKTPVAPLIKKSTSGRARKTMPGSPRLETLRGALSKSQGTLKSAAESSKPPDVPPAQDDHATVPLSSPLQIRQSIRRSLAEVLFQRINKSDHSNTTEREVEQLAVNMEKDMFNMCYTTDEVYKDKCQHLIHNLKDSKNKELCHQLLNGEISPIKLIHFSEQNFKSSEDTAGDSVHQILSKEEWTPQHMQERPLVCQEKVLNSTNTVGTTARSHEIKVVSQRKQSLARNLNSDVPDMISSMLKDTTLQHKRHLFDINCKICTGQLSADGDSEMKKLKIETAKDNTEEKSPWVVYVMDEVAPPATIQDSNITESPASPTAENCETQTPSADSSPVLIPSVPIMSISRRDPRTAQFRQVLSSCTDPKFASPQLPPLQETLKDTDLGKPTTHVLAPMLHPMPKSILTKPSPAAASRLDTSYGSRLLEAHTPSDEGTKQFLSKQDIFWRGFLNMPTVAKFVTKGYLISGSSDFLKEDLPDTIQIGGRILPQTVWEYVELIKTSEAKEMSLIRFHPSSCEEEVAYVSLFSYFNSRRRFGVVSNVCKHIKDLYLIPLCAKQSIPSVLLPIQGPGLEQNHPNLLVGLVVCQKPKHPETFLQEVSQKKSGLLIRSDSKEANNSTSLKTIEVGQYNTKACDPDTLIKTSSNPCEYSNSLGSPDPYFSRSLPCSSPLSSVFSQTKPLTCDNPDPLRDSTATTPLQNILHTLFGQRKQNPNECEINPSTDKVQQLQHGCKEANTMALCDDRPYDPEEYDPALTYEALESESPTAVANNDDDRPYDPEEEYNAVNKGDTTKDDVLRASEESSTVNNDVAYDPEDETMFEEMQNYLADNVTTHQKITICEQDNISNTSLSEQQKILEELNRQIEEQKRQLEEQAETLRLQKEAIGVSMAHFSVSHALMSPPPQFGRENEEESDKLPYPPIIHEIGDPQTCRKASKDSEDESETLDNKNVSLDTKENQTAFHDASLFSNQEQLDCDKTLPSKGEPDTKTAQLHSTTRSRSEYHSETRGSRRSSRKSWPERKSYHQDRTSLRASYKTKVPKDVSEKHSRSRNSSKHLSRSHSDRRRLTLRTRHHHHHHRDSSSPPRYKRRSDSSTRSHSSWRDRSSQEDSDRSHKTDEQQPRSSGHNAQSLQPGCEQHPGSRLMLCAAKQLAEIQQRSSTKPENVEGSQKPQTSQNPREKPLNNNAFDTNQPFSGNCEIKRTHLPLSKTDHSSKQGLLPLPCAQNVNTAHSDTDQLLNSTTPALKQYSGNEEPSNQTACFSGKKHPNQKRDLPAMQRQNYLPNEADKLFSSGDYQQMAFQSQYKDFPQSNNSQFNCRDISLQELPQKKTRDLTAHESDCLGQLQTSHKHEGFTSGQLSQCDKQIFPNYIDQAHQGSQGHEPPQAHGNNVQEPEMIHFHHQKGPYMKGHFHRDKFQVSSQFQQRGSILGPVDKSNFRPRSLNTSCFDKCKPSREPLSKMERSTFGHSQGFVPGGPSPGSCMFQDGTDTHSNSRQIMNEMMGPVNAEGPSEEQFQDSQLSHSSKGHALQRQFNSEHNTEGYASFNQFHKGHSNYRGFPRKQRPPPHDLCESQSPNCHQTFGEKVEAFQTLKCQSQRYTQELTCGASQSLTEGWQGSEIKGQPRGPQQSGFRGQDGGNIGPCFARGHNVNAQTRAPRFDSPQQFKDQRAPSPVFHGQRKPSSQNIYSQFKKPEHQNRCESQNLWQPFECPTGQTNIRPLRGPLLPTPRGCRITPPGNIPRLQRPNSHNESTRSQGPASVRHHPGTSDISGSWIHGEKPSIGHNFNPHRSDISDSQEEQRVGYDGRRGQQSVHDRSYEQPSRETRGRNISRRGVRRQRFEKTSHQ